jgi:hypothetical protein
MHSLLGAAGEPHVAPVYRHGMGGKPVAGHPHRDAKRCAAKASREALHAPSKSTKRRRKIKAAEALLAFNAPASPPHGGDHDAHDSGLGSDMFENGYSGAL